MGNIIADQGGNMRCAEVNCPYRQTVMDAAAARKFGQVDDMQNEDIITILDSMMELAEELDELDEASGQGGRDQGEV